MSSFGTATKPCFSVVVPHRNRPAILRESLRRLQALWSEWLLEVIVVDDASDEELIPSADDLGPDAVLIRHAERRGAAACRNEGARRASGKLLLFLDDDSWPVSGSLGPVVEAFARRPELAAIGLRVLVGPQCESGGCFNAFVACGAVVDQQAFLEVGGFPEEYVFYVEEYELCYRLIEAGYGVRMWEQPTVFHQKAAAQRDEATIIRQLIVNNRRLLEPHVADHPEISKRLAEMLAWYELRGKCHGVQPAALEAVAQPLPMANCRPWSERFWREISGADLLEQFVEELCRRGLEAVSLWPVGKDCGSFAEALRRRGIVALEALDPHSRFGVAQYAGLPVVSRPSGKSQGIVVSSFSPGLCWNALWGSDLADQGPVYCGFGYVNATSPRDEVVRRPIRNIAGAP